MQPGDVYALLARDNPTCPADQLRMYSQAFSLRAQAVLSITESGAVVIHPVTGSPIENPSIKIMAAQDRIMVSLKRVRKTDALWKEM